MKSTLNKEPYVSTNLNRNTGQSLRQWIEYADGVFEPVRKNGNLNKRYHGNKRTLDWWTVDKPLDWNPADQGKEVSLNHDYGQKKHILAESKADSSEDAAPGELTRKTVPTKSAAPGNSTLSQGAAGLWEHMVREKAEAAKSDNSTQAARKLGEWEREQGIDPNQGSGHERRPPSSSKDAIELEKAATDRDFGELIKHLIEMRDNPPWGKKQPPLEKVQGVTHPAGQALGEEVLGEMLKNRNNPVAKILGHGLGKLGPFADVLTSPEDAW